jgi:basic membrane protein A
MTRKFAAVSAAVVATVAATLAGCGSSHKTTSGAAAPSSSATSPATSAAPGSSASYTPIKTIGYVLSGPSNDQGYYQAQAEAIQRIANQMQIKVIISQNVDPNNSTSVFEDLARQGASVVIGDGSEFIPGIVPFSSEPAFARTLPLMISGDPPTAPTYATVGGNELQAHFMGGVAAGLLLQADGKNTACDVAGPNLTFVKNAAAAMQQGLKYVNPNYRLLVTYTGDFNNDALAASAAKALVAQGCDVMYPYLGGAIPAALNVGAAAGVKLVATSYDRCASTNPPIAMDILFNPSLYLPQVVGGLVRGELRRGAQWKLFSVNDHVGIGAKICQVTPQQTQALTQAEQKLANGTIDVPKLIGSNIQG